MSILGSPTKSAQFSSKIANHFEAEFYFYLKKN